MNRPQKPGPRNDTVAEPEIQKGARRSIANDERLKRAIRQHPQRDEPKVDSIEPATPPQR